MSTTHAASHQRAESGFAAVATAFDELLAPAHVGRNSLIAAAAGAVLAQVALLLFAPAPAWLAILVGGFEAALIGALADWFAVSALFRRIPIPLGFVADHTDIIRKRRPHLVQGIRTMVETHWLTPDVIIEQLARLSVSRILQRELSEPSRRRRAARALRSLLRAASEHLDSPEVARTLGTLLKAQAGRVDLAAVLGRWMLQQEKAGRLDAVISGVLRSAAEAIRDEDARRQVERALRRAAAAYARQGTMKRIGLWLAETTSAIDYEAAAESLLDSAASSLEAMRKDREHPMRRLVGEKLREVATELAEGRGPTHAAVRKLQTRLIEGTDGQEMLTRLLGDLKAVLREELRDGASAERLLDSLLADLAMRLREDERLRDGVDAWARDGIAAVVHEHHHLIGDMVEQKLNALNDDELVTQIRDKVWDDLQFIRLNGAVVGFLVGAALASLKLALTHVTAMVN